MLGFQSCSVLLLVLVSARMHFKKIEDLSGVSVSFSEYSGPREQQPSLALFFPFFFYYFFFWVLLHICTKTEQFLFDSAANILHLVLLSYHFCFCFVLGPQVCVLRFDNFTQHVVIACRKSLFDSCVSKCMTKPSLYILLVSGIKLLYALVTH